MRIAHLILAHNNPAQLARLVDRLAHPDADIYIHLDLKSDMSLFAGLAQLPRVHFIKKRIKVYWGAYSIVQATLNGFKEILHTTLGYDYITLLSGNDYPIKDINEIHRFLADNPGKIFMEYQTEDSEWWGRVKTRVTKYHLTDFHFPGCHRTERMLNRVLPERQSPGSMVFVGSSQWLTITPESAKYVIRFLASNGRVRRFFRYSWGSDETAIQTILYNSPFKDQIVNDNYRYIDWSARKDSPKILNMDDKEKLKNSHCFFARKFDLAKQPEIFDYLDSLVNPKVLI